MGFFEANLGLFEDCSPDGETGLCFAQRRWCSSSLKDGRWEEDWPVIAGDRAVLVVSCSWTGLCIPLEGVMIWRTGRTGSRIGMQVRAQIRQTYIFNTVFVEAEMDSRSYQAQMVGIRGSILPKR